MPSFLPSVVFGLSQNPALRPDVLRQLIEVAEEGVLHVLLRRKDLDYLSLLAIGSRLNLNVDVQAASNPGTPHDVVMALSSNARSSVRAAIAARPDIDQALIVRFCSDADSSVREIAAQNSALPISTAEALLSSGNTAAIAGLASNRSMNGEMVAKIARSQDARHRAIVAEHPALQNVEAKVLSEDGFQHVRIALLDNPRIDQNIVDEVFHNDSPDSFYRAARSLRCGKHLATVAREATDSSVLIYVAANPVCPKGVIDYLLELGNQAVRRIAISHHPADSEKLWQLVRSKSYKDRILAAMSRKITPGLMELLFRDQEPMVRAALAENQACSANYLEILAQDENRHVRHRCSGNPATPSDVLFSLSTGSDQVVSATAASNPSFPQSGMSAIVEYVRRPATSG